MVHLQSVVLWFWGGVWGLGPGWRGTSISDNTKYYQGIMFHLFYVTGTLKASLTHPVIHFKTHSSCKELCWITFTPKGSLELPVHLTCMSLGLCKANMTGRTYKQKAYFPCLIKFPIQILTWTLLLKYLFHIWRLLTWLYFRLILEWWSAQMTRGMDFAMAPKFPSLTSVAWRSSTASARWRLNTLVSVTLSWLVCFFTVYFLSCVCHT